MSKCKVLSIANQKGGVAKTTTAYNLARALSDVGKTVLLIDLDPQSNLTMCFGVDKPEELDTTIYHLMLAAIEEENLPDKLKYIISKGNIDLIPCSIELSAIEVNLVNTMSRENILKNVIEDVKQNYDYVIIDCMPSLGMLTINELTACDSVLITALCETFCYAHL